MSGSDVKCMLNYKCNCQLIRNIIAKLFEDDFYRLIGNLSSGVATKLEEKFNWIVIIMNLTENHHAIESIEFG